MSSPASLAAWFQVQQLPKWNALQHAAFLHLSVERVTTIFVKIIFTHKSFLKIHLTVSWLNLLLQPPHRYLSPWTCTWGLFHSFDTSDATVFTSQPTQGQNTHKRITELFNKWYKGPTSSLPVHSLCQYTSSKCTQVESVSEIARVRVWAVCHTANIHSIVGLAVQWVQRLKYKAQSP